MTKKTKPIYEFIRYDIRPPSGLSDVESDYITECTHNLENHPNVEEVQCCFELPSAMRLKRSTGKHAHLGIRFKKGIRTDKVPIIKINRLSITSKSVKLVTAEKFTVGHYWKMGYIQKDGQHFGKSKDYHKFWLEHERCLNCKVIRLPDMTCGSICNDVVNWWYQEHENIRKKHTELKGRKNALGVIETPPLDIRHVYAHYMISVHPNNRMNRKISRRLWLIQTVWSDYDTLVKMATDPDMIEKLGQNYCDESRYEYVDRTYVSMDKIYPIEGEY